MSRAALVPRDLTVMPFRARDAVAQGLVTRAMLRGRTWRRLFHDVYVHGDAFRADDHRMWCDAVALLLQDGAVIDGLSAAYLFGVHLLPPGAPVSVPPHHRSLTRHGIVSRRTSLAAADVTSFAGIPLTTPMETRLRLLLWDAGAPPPVAQHEIRDRRGRLVGRDIDRVDELRALGWLVLRFTADDVLRHPGRVVRHVAAAVRERRP